MPTKLTLGKKIVREIPLRMVDSPVVVTITADGLSFRVPGTRKSLGISWHVIVDHSTVPFDAPSKFHDRPFEFLQEQGRKRSN